MRQGSHATKKTLRTWATCAAVLGGATLLVGSIGAGAPRSAPEEGTFIGASKCKSCHSSEEVGDQYGKWESGPHSKAFETLASEEAMAIAKERGIEDPQKAEACLKCHVTAHGVDEERIKRGFKMEAGVQCESCHGPGEDHMKARFKAAMSDDEVPVGPDEIVSDVTEENCRGCHNEENPTFDGFCFPSSLQEIRHLRPENAAQVEEVDCTECHDPVPEEG